MTKRLVEVRDDLNKLIDAMKPGGERAVVARTVEQLDTIIAALSESRGECICPTCGLRHGGSNVDGGL